MRVFISYHREDTKYKNCILEILKENSIEFYCWNGFGYLDYA